jgi:hypothetical protein
MRMWEGAIDIYSDKASRPCRGCRLLSGLHYWPSWRIISYEYREAPLRGRHGSWVAQATEESISPAVETPPRVYFELGSLS